MLTAIDAAYRRLLAGLGLLAGASFAALALLVTLNVVLRATRLAAMPWLLEFSEYLLFWATLLAAPWVLSLGAHVRVDLVLTVVPARLARGLEGLADLLGAAFSLVLAVHGWRIMAEAFRRGDVIVKEIVVAEWVLLAAIPLAGALLAIEFARRFRRHVLRGEGDGAGPVPEGF